MVDQLDALDALRPSLDAREATNILWTLNHPTRWHLLVRERDWPPPRLVDVVTNRQLPAAFDHAHAATRPCAEINKLSPAASVILFEHESKKIIIRSLDPGADGQLEVGRHAARPGGQDHRAAAAARVRGAQ